MAYSSKPICYPDFGRRLRGILAASIKRSGKSRPQIAREMTELLPGGRPMTKGRLDEYTRNATLERDIQFPAIFVPAFCRVVGNDELRFYLMGEKLRGFVELGEAAFNVIEHARLTGQRRKKGAR